MPAYALFDNLEVRDPEAMKHYVDCVHAIVEQFGGRYLVVGGEIRSLEGEPGLTYPVLIEFPDLATAQAWYDSDVYAPLKRMRHDASRSTAVLIESAQSSQLDATPRA